MNTFRQSCLFLFLFLLCFSTFTFSATAFVPVAGSSSAVINAAISNVELAGGGIVTLEAGTHNVTDPILVPGGVILEGEGQYSVITGGFFGQALIANKYSGIVLQDMWMIRDLNLKPIAGVIGISSKGTSGFSRPNRLTIEDVQIEAVDHVQYAIGYECQYSSNTRVINLGILEANTGVYQDDCADNDYVNVSVQLGDGWGFVFRQTDPLTFNEGTRLVNATTNGQGGGVNINGADWVNISTSSFTTSPTLGAVLVDNNSVHWNIIGSEFAAAGGPPTTAGLVVQAGSVDGNVSGSKFVLNTFGAIINADNTRIVGNSFDNNYNVPLVTSGANNILHDNLILDSNGWNISAYSLWVQGTATTNSVKGNVMTQIYLDQGTNTNWNVLNLNMCVAGVC